MYLETLLLSRKPCFLPISMQMVTNSDALQIPTVIIQLLLKISGIKMLKFLNITPVQATEDSMILQPTVDGSPFLAQYVLFFWTAKSIIRKERFRVQEIMLDN